MGYLRALQLLTKAYKAAKGRMPEGLDLLKLKQKARQKAIDSTKGKLIQFPKDKITPFYKPRPTKTEIMMKQEGIPVTVKGKTTTMTPDGILKMLMGKGKGKDVKIGQAPKTKKVKEAVDPKLVQQESLKDLYKRLMRSNREAIKNFQKRNKPRDDKATGGLANLSQTYDNNPTLQSQFPDKQDYLDLFSSTTTTTPQTQTYAQMTQQQPAAGIPAIKPIVPIIPQGDGGDGGGGITSNKRNKNFDYETEAYGINPTGLSKDVFDYEYAAANPNKGIFQTLMQFSPTYQFMKAGKKLKDAGQKAIEDYFEKQRQEKAAKELAALQAAARAAGFTGGPGGESARSQSEQDFASSQTYGGGGTRGDMGADTFI